MSRRPRGRPRRKDRLRPLAELMPRVYPSREPEDVLAVRAFQWWERAVPERVARNARPVRLRRGVLTVHAKTAVWANELHFLREQLLGSLQRTAPAGKVRDLRIKVGPLPQATLRPRPVDPPPVIPIEKLPEDLARALAGVGDDSVRDVVSEAARVALGRGDAEEPTDGDSSRGSGRRRRD